MSDISDGVKVFVDQFRAQTDENMKRLEVRASEPKLVRPRGFDLLTTGKTCLPIQEFTEQLSDLAKRYKDACHDLDRERVAGRQMQQRADTLENKFKELEEATVSISRSSRW